MLSELITQIAAQLGLVAGILFAFFIGPGLAILFLLVRKARRRAARRSPIGINLLRGPGHTLREELEEAQSELTWDILILSVLPLVALSTFLAQAHLRTLAHMTRLAPLYVGMAVVVIGWMLWRMLKRGEHIDRLRTGYDAELAVGQELDTLMRHGAVVFHDFPAEGFNIDHVVVSVHGLYAVETKGYTKLNHLKGREGATVTFNGQQLRFPTWTTTEPVEQAERQAKWLGTWASSAVGETVRAEPVLALPGWFVQREGESLVQVLSGRELGRLFELAPGHQLSPSMVQRLAHQVEQRCRTVVPTYRRDASEGAKR